MLSENYLLYVFGKKSSHHTVSSWAKPKDLMPVRVSKILRLRSGW